MRASPNLLLVVHRRSAPHGAHDGAFCARVLASRNTRAGRERVARGDGAARNAMVRGAAR
jgi:hypothetical protein